MIQFLQANKTTHMNYFVFIGDCVFLRDTSLPHVHAYHKINTFPITQYVYIYGAMAG